MPPSLRIRTVADVDEFAHPVGDQETIGRQAAALWESGASRPQWCFVAEDDSGACVGRVGYLVEPTVTDPAWQGSLPRSELFPFGLWLPWKGVHAGRELLRATLAAIRGDVPDRLDVRVNREDHDHVEQRLELCGELGMTLFQEKEGFTWRPGAEPIEPPDRLRFATVTEVGRARYQHVLARSARDTLDRNDRWYRAHMKEAHWGAQMMEYLSDEDAPSWLVGFDPAGDAVGMVAVCGFEPGVATIGFIGVIPEHRGRGYANDLLLAGTAVAHARGFGEMLSDVDTLNQPMIDAMRRAGHLDGVRPWHVWHYRVDVASVLARS